MATNIMEEGGQLMLAAAASSGAALLQVQPGSSNINGSTYNGNSFRLTNSGSQDIVSATVDLRTAGLPGLVYDPAGGAGDTGPKNLTIDSNGGTGVFQPAKTDYSSYTNPFNGGWRTMTLRFDQAVNSGFDPGETMTFSLDIDPTSIRNSGVQGDAGSISGFELFGATVTVTYADGTSQTGRLMGDGSVGGSRAALSSAPAPAPSLSLAGHSEGKVAVSSQLQIVDVSGQPGSSVKVLIMTGGMGNNVQPADIWDANKAIAVSYKTVALDASGKGSFTISVPADKPLYLAATTDKGGEAALVSGTLIVARGSGGPPPADTSPPSATGVAADISAAVASHSIAVTYADSGSGVNISTIGAADISVSGPTAVSVGSVTTKTNSDGSVTATYTLNSPDGFTAADNGSYTVSLAGGAVTDNAGNAIGGKTLDGFTVNIGSSGGGGSGDEINGTPGDDVLNGTSADDTINGLAGKDKINGLAGNDIMKGGIGNDIYFVESAGDQVIELAGEGTDEVNAYLSYTLPSNVENLRLRGGNVIDGTGNELNNRIIGNNDANKISGAAGNDNITGSGAGDMLSGGAGNDIYRYEKTSDSTGSALDHILDFTLGEDKIDLSPIDANSAATGNQAFSFIGSSAFSGAAGQVRFDTGTPGVTGIFADVNGDKIADLHIQIDSSVTLNTASFVL